MEQQCLWEGKIGSTAVQAVPSNPQEKNQHKSQKMILSVKDICFSFFYKKPPTTAVFKSA